MMMKIMQNIIAKLTSEFNELKSLFLFNASLTNFSLLEHFQEIIFRYTIFSKNLTSYLFEQRVFNDYFLVRHKLILLSTQTVKN